MSKNKSSSTEQTEIFKYEQLNTQIVNLIENKKQDDCLQIIDSLGDEASMLFVSKMHIVELGTMMYPKNYLISLAITSNMETLADKLISVADSEILNHITNKVSLLSRAALAGMDNICKKLIPLLSDECINSADIRGYTALTYSISSELNEVSRLLIDKMSNKAISSYEPSTGITALSMAIAKGSDELCRLIIPKTSTEAINVRDDWSYTALMSAIDQKLEDICLLLIPKMNCESLKYIKDNKNYDIAGTAYIAKFRGLEEASVVLIDIINNHKHDESIEIIGCND